MVIGFFNTSGALGFCSNWYKADIVIDGIKFNCCEQYMMYQKALLFGDTYTAARILNTSNPAEMKKLGRRVNNFDEYIWNKNKIDIVYKAVLAKFQQHSELRDRLLSTGNNILAEASPYDKIWGIGMSTDEDIQDMDKWRGQNLLGQVLVGVRGELRDERDASE